MEINPDKMNVVELKALAYDILVLIDKHQKDLTAINQIIAERVKNGRGKDTVEPPEKVRRDSKKEQGTKKTS